jgi:hypothetical protein
MDTLRSSFGSSEPDVAAGLDDTPDRIGTEGHPAPVQVPPALISNDERRMQVRAYNHWASLLEDRMFPLVEDLDPASLPDFGPYSVLIDFTEGIEDPAVQFLGDALRAECDTDGPIAWLSDVPPRSLLSRITDHYLQIIANHAPIGFEAEFVNQRGAATLYRGILLPYSSDGETIDFIYGVINWKEIADQVTADELLLEIDQALDLVEEFEDGAEGTESPLRLPDPVTEWADSPLNERGDADFANIAALPGPASAAGAKYDLPVPAFGLAAGEKPDFTRYGLDDYDEDYEENEGEQDDSISYNFASLADYIEAPVKKAIDPATFVLDENNTGNQAADYDRYETEDDAMEHAGEEMPYPDVAAYDRAAVPGSSLQDHLAAARELALAANTTEDRSRSALYAAVSRAYDFAIASLEAPDDYAELIAESGLTIQERAPMTPVVKLVFGADYDKTRLTEYAAVLSHAHRLGLERGSLVRYLEDAEGGLKGVVKAERRLRRQDAGEEVECANAVREALAQRLRELEALTLEALDGGGPEFALVMIRRDEIGCAHLIGELPEEIAPLERAARKLIG